MKTKIPLWIVLLIFGVIAFCGFIRTSHIQYKVETSSINIDGKKFAIAICESGSIAICPY